MIYSLTDDSHNRIKIYKSKKNLGLAVEIDGKLRGELRYNQEQLNDLINALNLIKSKIEKEVKNG